MLRRTDIGLFYAFTVQYDGLRLSAAFYDVGHKGEAVRMANAIFVLLGLETKNHKSIVEQLAYTDKVTITSTAPAGTQHGSALIAVNVIPYRKEESGRGGWIIDTVPRGVEALESGRHLAVADWWNEGVLRGVGDCGNLTRLQLVRVLRDQDGGAHLDDHIKDTTYLAAHLRGVGFQYKPSAHADSIPVEGAIEATVRQMASEVLSSLVGLFYTAQFALREAQKGGPLSMQYFEDDAQN